MNTIVLYEKKCEVLIGVDNNLIENNRDIRGTYGEKFYVLDRGQSY